MRALLRLAQRVAVGAVQHTARRVARVSALLAVALLFAMLGLTGFAAAAFILLARVLDPALAALLLGALCFTVAALLLLVARASPPTRPEDQARRDLMALVETAGKSGVWLPLLLAVLGGLMLTTRRK
jgi:hypothetical protein